MHKHVGENTPRVSNEFYGFRIERKKSLKSIMAGFQSMSLKTITKTPKRKKMAVFIIRSFMYMPPALN